MIARDAAGAASAAQDVRLRRQLRNSIRPEGAHAQMLKQHKPTAKTRPANVDQGGCQATRSAKGAWSRRLPDAAPSRSGQQVQPVAQRLARRESSEAHRLSCCRERRVAGEARRSEKAAAPVRLGLPHARDRRWPEASSSARAARQGRTAQAAQATQPCAGNSRRRPIAANAAGGSNHSQWAVGSTRRPAPDSPREERGTSPELLPLRLSQARSRQTP